MIKNIKYYAGLLDSDGSIQLMPYKVKDRFVLRFMVSYSQKTSSSWILEPLSRELDIDICHTSRVDVRTGKINDESKLNISSNKCIQFLDQIGKHLVVKKVLADFALKMDKREVSQLELKQIREVFKDLRSNLSPPTKNFPSRQWLAGYIDGDGSIGSSFRQRDGNLEFRCVITTHKNDPQGIELIHKYFGGYIVHQDNISRLGINLTKSKGEQFITYFNSHLKLKKNQFDFVLNVLRKGLHLKKNGANAESNYEIHSTLKEMKKPQRLNEQSSMRK